MPDRTSQIALLRAVNVGGHARVSMADLRALVERLGFEDVRSLLQTGNLVFRGGRRSGAQLESLLEAEAARRLALQTDFFVRSADEWRKVVARNPFPEEASRDPGHLLVVFLKAAAEASKVEALQAAISGREVVRGDGRQLYAVYPDGIGRSRLTIGMIESRLGTRGTARNWNTVLKLAARADD